jgi:hypothetical protein
MLTKDFTFGLNAMTSHWDPNNSGFFFLNKNEVCDALNIQALLFLGNTSLLSPT